MNTLKHKGGITVFVSYAHEDEEFRVALGKHLRALERQGLITAWHDRMISAGAEWRKELDENLESAGIVGGEELRTMGFFRRSSHRLSWLSINVLLNIAAASVIALHQEILSAVIILAVFLPIISDMSGCSGNQAVAVSIRELTLGVIRPRDVLRVFWKEGMVGVLNGIVLGILLGGVAWLWQDNI